VLTEKRGDSANEIDNADVRSTLSNITATSIIRAINQCAESADEIYIYGDGAHNQILMQQLQAMTKCSVATTEAPDIHPDWVEAMAFAWLAYQNHHQQTSNLPSVTGARESVILGEKTISN